MNERIAKLIEECTDRHFSEGGGFETFDKEKFAELIVLEMCQVINADCESQYSEGITTNLGGLNQARELIKEHFGVEE